MTIFELRKNGIQAIPETSFSEQGFWERRDLQRLLLKHIEVIDPDTKVIAEEFGSWEDSRRRIDILGLDKLANLVVIELKRSEDGGFMDLQALRYAAMISVMTFDQVVDAYSIYIEKMGLEIEARHSILTFLGWYEPDDEKFANDVRIVLVSADFSKELTTSVLWLNERGQDIRCVRIRPYKHEDRILLDVQQIIPLPEASEFQTQVRNKQERQWVSRQLNRDLTRYDVTLGTESYAALPKRWAIYRIIRHLTDSGISPEQIIEAIGFRKNRILRSVDGEMRSEEFIRKLKAEESEGGRIFDPGRHFCNEDELIFFGGKTCAVHKMWGKTTHLAIENLRKAFPEQRIEIKEFRDT
jgi:hypothetical protein